MHRIGRYEVRRQYEDDENNFNEVLEVSPVDVVDDLELDSWTYSTFSSTREYYEYLNLVQFIEIGLVRDKETIKIRVI